MFVTIRNLPGYSKNYLMTKEERLKFFKQELENNNFIRVKDIELENVNDVLDLDLLDNEIIQIKGVSFIIDNENLIEIV